MIKLKDILQITNGDIVIQDSNNDVILINRKYVDNILSEKILDTEVKSIYTNPRNYDFIVTLDGHFSCKIRSMEEKILESELYNKKDQEEKK